MSVTDFSKLLQSYLTTKTLNAHNIDSFNQFVLFGIPSIVNNEVIHLGDKQIQFKNTRIERPCIQQFQKLIRVYPQRARLEDLTYSSNVMVDVDVISPDSTEHVQNVSIGRVPMMVKSVFCHTQGKTHQELYDMGECPDDLGGYFIINGNEKVIVTQVREAYNTIFVQQEDEKYTCKMRSMSSETRHSLLVTMVLHKHQVKCSLPRLAFTVPLGHILKLYEIDIEHFLRRLDYLLPSLNTRQCVLLQDILQHIRHSFHEYTIDQITQTIREKMDVKTQEDEDDDIEDHEVVELVVDLKKDHFLTQILHDEMFPHLGIVSSPEQKVFMLWCMVNRMLRKVFLKEPTDREHYANKRFETPGILLTELFGMLFKKYTSELQQQMVKRKTKFDMVSLLSKNHIITEGIFHSLSTGKWGARVSSYVREGVSQLLTIIDRHSILSHLRRIVTQIGKMGKGGIGTNLKEKRQLHCSSYGFTCSSETPEGETVGTTLNMALTCAISLSQNPFQVRRILKKSSLFYDGLDGEVAIFLNGAPIGSTNHPIDLVKTIPPHFSCTFDFIHKEIVLFTDAGRCMRPLFVRPTSTNVSWAELLQRGHVRYFDAYQIDFMHIGFGLDEKRDAYEIHPCCQFGCIVNCIPFPDHTQSPRIIYQASMGKQSIGIISSREWDRTDTSAYTLWNPSTPIVSTAVSRVIEKDFPAGMTCIVAIATIQGFNQEDSIVLNKASIDKGLFCATYSKTIVVQVNSEEVLCNPSKLNEFNKDYSLLDDSGIVRVNSIVSKGDIIVGKINTVKGKTGDVRIDSSVKVDVNEYGTVKRIYNMKTVDGKHLIKIVIRRTIIPEQGDKFASRNAQKGTCSLIMNSEDMPFTLNGVTPDIIINPHCIPSRMTINQILECVCGKIAALSGEVQDATPFSESSIDIAPVIASKLHSLGFQCSGKERLYSGMTGELIESSIFIGPTYYQRLKHLVQNKMHARSVGQVTNLMRQPLEGRSKNGGLRFGEMERDTMIAHGAAYMLHDRLYESSDPAVVHVCRECKHIIKDSKECVECPGSEVVPVMIPNAGKVFFQQLETMGIKTDLCV